MSLSIEQIIAYLISPAIAAGWAIGAIIKKVVLPWYLKRQTKYTEHNMEAQSVEGEHRRASESITLKQWAKMNEGYADLLKTSIQEFSLYRVENNKLFKSLEELIEKQHYPLTKTLASVNTQLTIANRERIRLEEVHDDIEQQIREVNENLLKINTLLGRFGE